MTAACTIEPRVIERIDGAAGAGGEGGTGLVRDASQEASDARAGSDGAGGMGGMGGAGGGNDASSGGNAGSGGSSGAGGGGGAGAGGGGGGAGTAGSGGTGGGSGSGGAGGAGASGGSGGTSGAAGNAGVAGLGVGGAAGIAGAGGAAGIAGALTGGSGGLDAGTTGGTAGQTGNDAGDVRLVDVNRVDAATGDTVVLFEDTFPLPGLGTFTVVDGCGTPPEWSNGGGNGFAHADDPENLGVSSIVSPTIPIPANVSNVRLRLHHQVVTQVGHDGAQVLVSKNGATPQVVTSFTPAGYVNGVSVNADTANCAEGQPGDFPGWSGNLPADSEPEANLSAAAPNVGPGDTVSIRLRIVVDSNTASGGWNVDWVRLTGTVQ
jgi:hypothetical protein